MENNMRSLVSRFVDRDWRKSHNKWPVNFSNFNLATATLAVQDQEYPHPSLGTCSPGQKIDGN